MQYSTEINAAAPCISHEKDGRVAQKAVPIHYFRKKAWIPGALSSNAFQLPSLFLIASLKERWVQGRERGGSSSRLGVAE